jgi:ATPase family associated with various cellular activities (AAA)
MDQFSPRALFALPVSLIAYEASRMLSAVAPYVLETNDGDFDYEGFVRAKRATMTVSSRVHAQKGFTWIRPAKAREDVETAWVDLEWDGKRYEIVQLAWSTGCNTESRKFVLAESKAAALALFEAVCRFTTSSVDEQVLVFERGSFRKSAELYRALKRARFDSLILPPELAASLRTDFRAFFDSKETFAKYGLPYKRGALFTGPPGNGKTHAVKAIVGELGQPCLYVKSLQARHHNDHESLETIFSVARETAPCVLVLEDLDALVDDNNRSFLLNELDGFADNHGLVTMATTNYPQALDPALVDRPSRFDRLYAFPLPDLPRRAAFLEAWRVRLDEEVRPSSRAVERVAELTSGFSFAYLKELGTSTLLAWVGEPRDIDTLLEREAKKLAMHVRRGDVSRVLG